MQKTNAKKDVETRKPLNTVIIENIIEFPKKKKKEKKMEPLIWPSNSTSE